MDNPVQKSDITIYPEKARYAINKKRITAITIDTTLRIQIQYPQSNI
jgi:hypothetical protein